MYDLNQSLQNKVFGGSLDPVILLLLADSAPVLVELILRGQKLSDGDAPPLSNHVLEADLLLLFQHLLDDVRDLGSLDAPCQEICLQDRVGTSGYFHLDLHS